MADVFFPADHSSTKWSGAEGVLDGCQTECVLHPGNTDSCQGKGLLIENTYYVGCAGSSCRICAVLLDKLSE